MKDTALLLIDFINDIIHPKGAIGRCAEYVKEYSLIKHTNETIEMARSKKIPLIFITVGFSPDYRELLKHSPLFSLSREKGALQLGTWGCEIHDEIARQKTDTYIVKHSVSPFYGTPLDLYLRRQNIERLIVGGVSTDMAIQSTVREGHDRGYQMVICEEICGALTRKIHLQSLELLQRLSTICTIDELNQLD